MSASSPQLEVDVQTVKRMLDERHEFLLLDCREPDEHELARIDRAVLIPLSQLPERVSELEPHRDRPIVVHCHHGVRSLRVTHWLIGLGFARVQSMRGGIDAWSLQIDPGMARY
ncbi:MAG: rhodanese [Pirellulaceae bacterium]|nr:rhodanese [Pirellulaceae bacterium]